eukprot:719197-Ditylum_brightwellii.AAC.1
MEIIHDIPEEYMADPIPPPSHKVSTNLDDELIHLIKGSKIAKYWINHYTSLECAVKQIDWPTVGKAWSNQNFSQCNWPTKWAAEKLLTDSEMEDMKAWNNAICPQQCSEELEDPDHIILCPKENQLLMKIQKYYSCGVQRTLLH